jgi:putative restriction endonuclease
MRLNVAITDDDWYEYLSRLAPDEVNFWQPSGGRSFKRLSTGEPLLFKLHSPNNYIVGGGFFSHYSPLPASFAWRAFAAKNGAATEQEMRQRIERYRRVPPNATFAPRQSGTNCCTLKPNHGELLLRAYLGRASRQHTT